MKTPTRFAMMSVSLCLGLLACQSIPQAPLSSLSSPSSPRLQTDVSSTVRMPSKAAPIGRLIIEPNTQSATAKLRFQIQYPPQATGFQTQALNYGDFSSFQVSIRGIGFSAPLYPATVDSDNRIAAVGCNNTVGCQLNTSIDNVPSGENRIATIIAYDANGDVIPGSTLAAAFTIDPEETSTTVHLSYRSTPAGQIADGLLQQTLNLLLAEMDVVALQAKLDQIMGAGGVSPDFTYTTHPALLNVTAILNDFKLNDGDITALDPTNPAYVNAGGTVKGKIEGLLGQDTVNLRLSDPATGEVVGQSNADFQFDKVPAGTWKLVVDAPAGYTIPGLPSSVTVTEAGTLDLGDIQLERIQPTITSVAPASLFPGQKVTINGTHFANQAADNEVTIGGVTIPANQITVISSTQLEVTVPSSTLPGATQVSLTVGGKQATNQPSITVLALSASDWTQGWASLGANTENVLAVTASIQSPDQVFYGSKAEGASLGGIWRCDESIPECTQVETGKAATAGSVQAIVMDPENSRRIYAGSTSKGLLRSIDNGLTWETANTGLTNLDVRSIVVNPKNSAQIYIGTRAGGVFYSSDYGDHWSAVNTGLTASNIGSVTLFYPHIETDPAYVYAGTKGAGVYRSSLADPSALSWTKINNNLSQQYFLSEVDVTVLVNHPTQSGLQYGAGTGGCLALCQIFFGKHYYPGIWRRTEDPVPANSYWKQIGHNGVNEYDGDGGVHVLEADTNVGLSNMDVLDLDFDPLDSDKIYASTKNGIYLSLKPDQIFTAADPTSNTSPHNTLTEHFHWRNLSTGLPANSVVSSAALHPLKMYIGTNSGLYRAQ